MICFLLVRHLDDVINMAFHKTENSNNYYFHFKLFNAKAYYNKSYKSKVENNIK